VEASGIEWGGDRPICLVCRQGQLLKRWKRVVIDAGTWTGEDVFYARGMPGTILVSERFKEVCERHGVQNAAFLPAEECFRESCPWEIANWEIRQFNETLAVLQSWNKRGRLDPFIEAMHRLRPQVLANPKLDWIEELRKRFDGRIDAVGDAAAEAQYNLVGMPRPRKV